MEVKGTMDDTQESPYCASFEAGVRDVNRESECYEEEQFLKRN